MIAANFRQTADQRQTGHVAVLLVGLLLLIQMLMLPQEGILELWRRECFQ